MLNSDTKKELIITSPEAKKVLLDWFDILSDRKAGTSDGNINGRAWRAELRRMTLPYGVMMCAGYDALRRKLAACMPLRPVDEMALALFVSVAVHIKTHKASLTFAAQLGEKINDKPCMSALRFERLQQTQEPEDFCLQLIRAVRLRESAGEGVNIISLADSIFIWMREWQQRQEEQPENPNPFARNRIRWASEYLVSSR